MGKYIGKVDIIGNFYNFMPLAVLEGHSVSQLTENDRIRLLPKSQLGNINFSYKPTSPWYPCLRTFLKMSRTRLSRKL